MNFGAGTSTGTLLSAGVSPFPTGVWTNSVVPQLLAATKISWNSNDYDVKEIMSATAARVRNHAATTNINGTSTLEVESGDVYLAYRFDKAINITVPNSKGNLETSAFEFSKPIDIKFLGKAFSIIGIANAKVILLNGAIGKSLTATAGLEFTNSAGKKYTAYAVEGSDNSWVVVSVKDSTGAEVARKKVNKGSSEDIDALDITIEATAVSAKQDNSVSGADLVGGPKGTTRKTIDKSADVTSTGTSNDALFEGFPDWGMEAQGTFANGQAEVNDEIRLVHKPASTKYLKIGQEIKGPNGIVLRNDGWNTPNFATVTFSPISGISATNISDSTKTIGSLAGIQIESDVASTVGGQGGNYYKKMAVVMNKTLGQAESENPSADFPVYVIYYDGSKWNYNGTYQVVTNSFVNANTQGVNAYSALVNLTSSDTIARFNYTFKLNYGGAAERTWFANFTFAGNDTVTPFYMQLGRAGATGDTTARYGLNISWRNNTVWDQTRVPDMKLGANAASSDDVDVVVTTEADAEQTGTQAGKKTSVDDTVNTGYVDNSGLIVLNPAKYTASDKVVIALPDKELQAAIYTGSSKAVTGTPMYSTTADVLSQVKAGTLAKNLILVGGPCANEVVEHLAGLDAADTLPTCKEWVGGATPKLAKGLVGVWAVGTKKALVIAGTTKTDTDAFATDFKLKGTTSVAPA